MLNVNYEHINFKHTATFVIPSISQVKKNTVILTQWTLVFFCAVYFQMSQHWRGGRQDERQIISLRLSWSWIKQSTNCLRIKHLFKLTTYLFHKWQWRILEIKQNLKFFWICFLAMMITLSAWKKIFKVWPESNVKYFPFKNVRFKAHYLWKFDKEYFRNFNNFVAEERR